VAAQPVETTQAPTADGERRQALSLSDRPPTAASASNSIVVQYAVHVVQADEDLSSIAALYGLRTQTLISINQIRNIQAIGEGSTLRIHDRDGQLYTVREGDMLSTIARRYSPSLGWKTLQEINGLKSEIITVGQQLFIPDTTSSSATQLVDRSPIQFQKPTGGAISMLFGQPAENPATGITEPLMGVLIQGSWGQAVVAAGAGQVVDAGYEVEGRGRFVTLSHEGGYRTSYHHLENVEVRIGMNLPKGGVIGSIGTSGTDWQRPTLFFSIEQSGIALDPSQFF
ncbi:MAG: M23 family metallopeptidase, partial [Spirochaetales bacterium]|nr:M23 family metallopeptidase [Spirochaetales bacterium]